MTQKDIKSKIRKIIFNNYAKFESSFQKTLTEVTNSQADSFLLFKEDLTSFEAKMNEFESRVNDSPEVAAQIYSSVGKMKETLRELNSLGKSFDSLLNFVGGVNLIVDFPQEQLESMLAFKNENYCELLRAKICETSDVDSPRVKKRATLKSNDLCDVLDALVNDDTQDRIQVNTQETVAQIYTQKTPATSNRNRDAIESPRKRVERDPLQAFDFEGREASQLAQTAALRRSIAKLTPINHLGGLLRKGSLREIQYEPKMSNFDESPANNLRNFYEDRTANREYFAQPITAERLSNRNEPSLGLSSGSFRNPDTDKNFYSKQTAKQKNGILYGSSLVTSGREPTSMTASGLSMRRSQHKSSYVTVLSKAGYVNNQVIDEARLRDIVSSLKSLAGQVKQVEFTDNTFKCNLLGSLRLVCTEPAAVPLKIDFKRNKFLSPQNFSKKDKLDLSMLNINIVG